MAACGVLPPGETPPLRCSVGGLQAAIQPTTRNLSIADPPSPPKILSIKDLDDVSEDLDLDTGKIRFTTFYIVDEDAFAFFGTVSKPSKDITVQDINSALARIPDEQIYPSIPTDSTLTVAPGLIVDEVDKFYTKRPNFGIYDRVQDSDYLSELLYREACIMEAVAKHPHPNIVGYHGVRVRRGRITGIILDRHKDTLLNRIREGRAINKGAFTQALASAVAYLHSIGLAHNDINPENVMVNEQDMPILIDFGSCQPPRKRLLTSGTVGWTWDTFLHSDQRNDLFALGKIACWLKNPTF
ncbi:hypothetical protein BU26DRAFT_515796 [Trematosphaeria pertusa]|uniref:non-specific serine/threonine protein kinase n=1 Tax=Trematosphaeria pertusa TaxID=390896 RepID=A0A6A6ISH3_9PLEO|nr:uncharacterized protein BU26DRAFT_515796 [Trematosphaeria pertusa]KAF2253441.1 hypothetical protein BU26DRAFT_515796 [Trematosphaeria pertusa]